MAVKMDYELEEFDANRLSASGTEWKKASIKNNAEAKWTSVYEPRLKVAATQTDYSNSETMSYGVFEKGKKVAVALVEVCYTRKSSKWVKMLNFHLSPEFDLSIDQNTPDFTQLAGIFTAAIVGTLVLTKQHKSKVIKLYARSAMLLSFFEFIAQNLPAKMENVPSFKVSIEDRWLVMKI